MQEFFSQYGSELLLKTWQQLYIALISVGLGVIVAVPLGIVLTRNKKYSGPIMKIVGILQTIPSLALLSLMIPIFGIGKLPAIVALFLYSLMPILRNTYVGIDSVDPSYIDAAKGMGMSSMQRLIQVELPLASAVILSGIRISTIYVISWTTLASYIGAGGLGDFIFNGLSLYNPTLILAGTIPVTLMALIIDLLLKKLEKTVAVKVGVN